MSPIRLMSPMIFMIEKDDTISSIAAALSVRAERGKRFADLTSLHVGGAIDWVLSPQTEAD